MLFNISCLSTEAGCNVLSRFAKCTLHSASTVWTDLQDVEDMNTGTSSLIWKQKVVMNSFCQKNSEVDNDRSRRNLNKLGYGLSRRGIIRDCTRVCPPYPRNWGGGGEAKLACGWGGGGSQFGRLERKPGTLYTRDQWFWQNFIISICGIKFWKACEI
jgi:hypothetical protein